MHADQLIGGGHPGSGIVGQGNARMGRYADLRDCQYALLSEGICNRQHQRCALDDLYGSAVISCIMPAVSFLQKMEKRAFHSVSGNLRGGESALCGSGRKHRRHCGKTD